MKSADYEQPRTRPMKRKRFGCRAYLLLMIILACLALSAMTVSTLRWQAVIRDSGIGAHDANPELNLLRRLYLQNYLVSQGDALRQPAGAVDDIQFEIAAGASAESVARDLVDMGLLNNPNLFLNYLRYFGFDSGLQAGQFTLNGHLTIPQLAAAISDGFGRNLTIGFLPGMRLEEMVQLLTVTSPAKIDPVEFQKLVRRQQRFEVSSYPFLNSLPPNATMEGFLFPDTYVVPPEANAVYLIDQMLQNFNRKVTPAMRQAYGARGLSLSEAVTLASIVQRETFDDQERPLIASVYLNRIQADMPLQADPTVQYAVGYQQLTNSWWKVPLSLADLRLDHPYNTYVVPGLPPGPIASPGLSSLQAIAEPAQTDYLFFVVDCFADNVGQHVFSRTYEEHLSHVQKCP